MDSTTTWIIIGGVAVAAWLGGFLTQFGFPPPGSGSSGKAPLTGPNAGLGQNLLTGAQQKLNFLNSGGFTQNSNAAYSYSGFVTAPLTVA